MMSSCALAHVQSHASCAVAGPEGVGLEGVGLEGVPRVPWSGSRGGCEGSMEPPFKDKLVL